MTYRNEILDCANKIVTQKQTNIFTMQEILDCMRAKGCPYNENTIRTHVSSRMCANSPDHHDSTYDDFERISDGVFRIKN